MGQKQDKLIFACGRVWAPSAAALCRRIAPAGLLQTPGHTPAIGPNYLR